MADDNYRTVIKRQHLRYREILIVLGAVSIGLILVVGFFLGQRAAYSGMGVNPNVYNELKNSLPAAKQELDALREHSEIQQMQGEMDRATLELVRLEMAAQQEKIVKLEEGLAFYQGLMAPEEIARGFTLRELELLPTDSASRFLFRLVAQQATVKHTTLKGSITLELYGLSGGEMLTFPLADLSDDIEDNAIALRFRYFQAIEGELVVPDNFVPQGFTVVANSTSPRKIVLREDYPWEVQTRFSYVGN